VTKISWRPFKNTASILGENNTTLFLGENNPTSFARTLDDQERGSWQELCAPASKYFHTGRARWVTRSAVVGRSSANLQPNTSRRGAHAGAPLSLLRKMAALENGYGHGPELS